MANFQKKYLAGRYSVAEGQGMANALPLPGRGVPAGYVDPDPGNDW
jgi:hypothetical protein